MENLNFALNKRVLEECNTPEAMLDGDCVSFDGTKGYCGVHVPAYLTIDLGENCEVGYIRFLLMHRPESEDTNHGAAPREYYYRLLACEDTPCINSSTRWHVIYDSRNNGYVDWQCFTLSEPMKMRYIRIHAIENRKNNGFHIVQFEAYARPVPLCEGAVVALDAAVDISKMDVETGDGMPLSKQLNDISGLLASIMKDDRGREYLEMYIEPDNMPKINRSVHGVIEFDEDAKLYVIKGEDIEKITTNFANDIKILERNSDGIERAIISPVQLVLTESRISNTKWTYWGLLSAIVSIVLLIVTIIIK